MYNYIGFPAIRERRALTLYVEEPAIREMAQGREKKGMSDAGCRLVASLFSGQARSRSHSSRTARAKHKVE